MNVRTYTESGRIALTTIKKVAIEHLISGNKVYCDKALKELKDAAKKEHGEIMHIYDVLTELNTGNHSKEHIQKQLIKNNIKYRTR